MPARFLAALALLLLPGCGVSNHTSEMEGTYRLVMPLPNMPALDASLQLTDGHAIYHAGPVDHAADYTVSDGYVRLQFGDTQLLFRIISRDTLRSSDAMGNSVDYVRVH